MGSIKSKLTRSDPSVALASHTQVLEERYQSFQERLDSVSQEFLTIEDFETKLGNVENNLKDNSQTLHNLVQEQTNEKEMLTTLSKKFESMQTGLKTFCLKLQNFEENLTGKFSAYEKALSDSQARISSLEKEVNESTEALGIFKLTKFSRLNGIHKEEKPPVSYHPIKNSLKRTPSSYKKGKLSTRFNKTRLSPEDNAHRAVDQENNSILNNQEPSFSKEGSKVVKTSETRNIMEELEVNAL